MPKFDFNKVSSNFIDITLRHGCFPVNLLHISRTLFLQNTPGDCIRLSDFHKVTVTVLKQYLLKQKPKVEYHSFLIFF